MPGVLTDVQHSVCRDAHLSTSFVNLPRRRREVLRWDSNLGIHFMQHQQPSPALPVLLLCWEQVHQRGRTGQKEIFKIERKKTSQAVSPCWAQYICGFFKLSLPCSQSWVHAHKTQSPFCTVLQAVSPAANLYELWTGQIPPERFLFSDKQKQTSVCAEMLLCSCLLTNRSWVLNNPIPSSHKVNPVYLIGHSGITK